MTRAPHAASPSGLDRRAFLACSATVGAAAALALFAPSPSN